MERPADSDARGGTVGNRAVANTKWIVLAPVAARAAGAAGTVVLARLLSPADYGLMAFAGVMLSFVAIFQDLGITQTLIAAPGEISAKLLPAFCMSAASGLLIYGLLSATASPFARFVGEPDLAGILLAMGLVVTLQTLGQVHHAILVRREAFRWVFAITVAHTASFVAISIVLGILGWGVWALALGHLGSHLLRTAALWAVAGWRPWRAAAGSPLYSPELLRFGGTLAGTSLLDWGAEGFLFLWAGKQLGSRPLGVYRVSFEAARMSYFGLPALASSVGLTSYAALQGDLPEMKRLMLKAIRVVNGVSMPVAACLVALAPWVVPVVWGHKWLEAAPVLSVLAAMAIAAPMANVVRPYLVTSGQVGWLLKLTTLRFALFVAVIPLAATHGIVAVAWAHLGLMILSGSALAARALRGLGGTLADILDAVLWPLLRAAACGLAALVVARSMNGAVAPVVLLASLSTGAAAYLGGVYLTSRASFEELRSVLVRVAGPGSGGRRF